MFRARTSVSTARRNIAYAPPVVQATHLVRSMSSGSDNGPAERDRLDDIVRIHTATGGQYPDRMPISPLKRLAEVAAEARAAVDTLRHIVQQPQDAAAQLCGAMVSKDYGAHEPAHTEHHIYRGSGSGCNSPRTAPKPAAGPHEPLGGVPAARESQGRR